MNKHDLTGAEVYAKEQAKLQLKHGLKYAAGVWLFFGFASMLAHLLGGLT